MSDHARLLADGRTTLKTYRDDVLIRVKGGFIDDVVLVNRAELEAWLNTLPPVANIPIDPTCAGCRDVAELRVGDVTKNDIWCARHDDRGPLPYARESGAAS